MYTTPVTLDAARAESKKLLPQDAQLVQSYQGPDSVPVDLYKSEALKTYFAGVTDLTSGKAANRVTLSCNTVSPTSLTFSAQL